MKVHYFQHVSFEGLGSIGHWLEARRLKISATKFYEGTSLPDINEIDWLIVMGGPMSVNDVRKYPWLSAEKEFIAQAIKEGKIVIGVCLGAQLIASALGAKVYPNIFKEIGWFQIEHVSTIKQTTFADVFPSSVEVFHWHGETFDLPINSVRIAQSEVCKNQAFSIGDNVLGLQFHLETTSESLKALIENCRNEIIPSRFIQSEKEMLENSSRFLHINLIMDSILTHFMKIAIQKSAVTK